ncbi:hypothetical protein AB0N89_00840 [Amycolatopsis sp. NPDC089917]|uniref:hypothetical protein n=1 Tax=Amycolatopsis sp. NPDC089917 TaxID=3155187 RepID=UPI00343CC3D6
MADPVFWLGPLGGLRALPSPSLGGPPEMVPVRFGGLHRSLTGRPTLDRLGVRRTWTLSWPYLDAELKGWLSLLHNGLVPGPLWLIDPAEPNRLPVQVATAGGVERAAGGIATAVGGVAWRQAPLVPPGTPAPAGSSALLWVVPSGGGSLSAVEPVPVLPGETVTFTASVAATVAVSLAAFVLDSAGAVRTTVQGTASVPGSGGTRMSLTVPASDGAAAVRPALARELPGVVTTSAWSITTGTEVPPWTAGGGAAVVLLDSLPWTYPLPGSFSTTLTLQEV